MFITTLRDLDNPKLFCISCDEKSHDFSAIWPGSPDISSNKYHNMCCVSDSGNESTDISTKWLSDLKSGFCKTQFYMNKVCFKNKTAQNMSTVYSICYTV